MSRGYGRVQRAILAHLRDDPTRSGQTMGSLTAAIGGNWANRSDVETVRRACRRLLADLVVDVHYEPMGRYSHHVVYLTEWTEDPTWTLSWLPFVPGQVLSTIAGDLDGYAARLRARDAAASS